MKKSKASLYIDGFNIYHRINDYQKKTGICYKWLNYRSLFTSLLKPYEEISDIYFFTAITQDFGLDAVQRHNKYIIALESQGIKIVKGYFSKCHQFFECLFGFFLFKIKINKYDFKYVKHI
jgi:hypothetical protein